MLRNILNINGIKKLNKNSQQEIKGGFNTPVVFGCDSIPGAYCIRGEICCQDVCLPPSNPLCGF